MIEVIDSAEMQSAIKRAVGAFGKENEDITYINISGSGSVLQEAYDTISKYSDRKFVLYGLHRALEMYLNPVFMKIMADYPDRVRYISIPFRIQDLLNPFSTPKHENRALKLFSDAEYRQDMAGVLLHELRKRTEEVMKKVKEIYGFEGEVEEIEKKLMELKGYEKELNEHLPGVFCDVYGTLLIGEGEEARINRNVHEMLREYSRDRPVNIWTGGILDDAVRDLIKSGFDEDIPILSKDFFRGCTAEIVIDDEDRETIEDLYNIRAEKFIRV
ncbi:MAG TPA: hypothetical protein ENG00_01420 [Candidatus Aenigmarchaeota archaeon]|nr:hypothetical protein [Candidatus Aenigmarchaeota archaeon]